MTIGDRIRKLRIASNLSQVELAQKAEISKQTLYKYETNIVTNIPSDKIELLAKILQTSPCHLMGWDETNCSSVKASFINTKLEPKLERIINYYQQMDETGKNSLADQAEYLASKHPKTNLRIG